MTIRDPLPRKLGRHAALAVFLLCGSEGSWTAPPPADLRDARTDPVRDRAGEAFFERSIRPLLHRRCYSCHSSRAKALKAELRLDTRAGLLAGSERGPVIVPEKPEESVLIDAVRYDAPTLAMPPSGRLEQREIDLLVEWVRRGAPYPESTNSETPRADASEESGASQGIDIETGRSFWSFRPLAQPALPVEAGDPWTRNRLDAFVRARQRQKQLDPAPEASRPVLLRRATFDLTGLPPRPDEITAFTADTAPDAYERVLDRLLASPAFGERWGRFWLDYARYGEADEWHKTAGQAYLYRDWVVRAFNEDMPYDDFVMRQLATDQMAETDGRDLPALGFLGAGPIYWKELMLSPEVIHRIVADEWEERVDAIARTFLGVTIACARCHDHKYDPFRTEDYYALAGVVANTRLVDRPVGAGIDETAWRKAHQDVESLEGKIAELQKQLSAVQPTGESSSRSDDSASVREEIGKLKIRVETTKASVVGYTNPLARAVEDASVDVVADGPDRTRLDYTRGVARDLNVHVRGDPRSPGVRVPRGFPAVLSPPSGTTFHRRSGRLELARTIVTDAAPLASRVLVNRVWGLHFLRGIVTTPSDFGSQGARPSHPRLLDALATQFLGRNGSLKRLHLELMSSATYRQSSKANRRAQHGDPENVWLTRMRRRRLEVEAWRDAMLHVADNIDRRLGGPPVDGFEIHQRRTVYNRVKRRDVATGLRLYDFPEPRSHSPERSVTTTPLQQLFVLNSEFFLRQSRLLAERLYREEASGFTARVRRAFWLLFGRPPTPSEERWAREFVAPRDSATEDETRAAFAGYLQALLGSNEFHFID